MDEGLEFFEERAAIREFDGLMTREEAERLAKTDTEDWREACELRWMLTLTLDERRKYLDDVRKHRGQAAQDALKVKFIAVWGLTKGKKALQ